MNKHQNLVFPNRLQSQAALFRDKRRKKIALEKEETTKNNSPPKKMRQHNRFNA